MKTATSRLMVALVGDVMLGRLVNEILLDRPPNYPWGNTLDILRSADFRLCNLECVISDRGEPWSRTPKVFHFESDAKNIRVLQTAEIDAVSLANNHTLDYGYRAMFEMLVLLDTAGIRHSGAGKNLGEASEPMFAERNGQKIGLVSFTDNEPDWEATTHSPGIFYVAVEGGEDERTARLIEVVRSARVKCDILIVAAHWGPNWGGKPLPEHVRLAHRLVDNGVDLIVGHSAHVCRGIEIYNGSPILYSTGDFIDDYAVDLDERNDQTFLFLVEFVGGKPHKLKLVPAVIRNFQACLAEGSEAKQISQRMIALSAALGTTLVCNPEDWLCCEMTNK